MGAADVAGGEARNATIPANSSGSPSRPAGMLSRMKACRDASLGCRLSSELTAHLRMSATPIRETLIRLQAEELLDTTPRRGFFVKTITLSSLTLSTFLGEDHLPVARLIGSLPC